MVAETALHNPKNFKMKKDEVQEVAAAVVVPEFDEAQQYLRAVTEWKKMRIEDAHDAVVVRDFDNRRKEAKGLAVKVEKRRKALLEPLKQEMDDINDQAKKLSVPLRQIEDHFASEVRAAESVLAGERAELEEARRDVMRGLANNVRGLWLRGPVPDGKSITDAELQALGADAFEALVREWRGYRWEVVTEEVRCQEDVEALLGQDLSRVRVLNLRALRSYVDGLAMDEPQAGGDLVLMCRFTALPETNLVLFDDPPVFSAPGMLMADQDRLPIDPDIIQEFRPTPVEFFPEESDAVLQAQKPTPDDFRGADMVYGDEAGQWSEPFPIGQNTLRRVKALELGEVAYGGYNAKSGGLSLTGKPLPKWEELPQKSRDCWAAAAEAVVNALK